MIGADLVVAILALQLRVNGRFCEVVPEVRCGFRLRSLACVHDSPILYYTIQYKMLL